MLADTDIFFLRTTVSVRFEDLKSDVYPLLLARRMWEVNRREK